MNSGPGVASASARRGAAEGAAYRLVNELGRRIRVGRLTIQMPDGTRRAFSGAKEGPEAEVQLRDVGAVWRILLGGEPGAGEAYMDGLWASPDLVAALRLAALNREALGVTRGWLRVPLQIPRTIAHRLRRNTIAGSRRNIAAHYDLSNDFYRLFLDETMTYSSAVFATPGQSLAGAQRNKYRIIAERAGLERNMHVLEIGTGWGGFALYAASEIGCRVTTITISRAQHDLAVERIREAGLDHLVSVQLLDYRALSGTYDAIVSIEMLEAVGAEYYEEFFGVCDRVLRPGGRISLQSICFPDVAYEPQRRGANWIQQYIFPGGLLPSVAQIERSLHKTRLLLTAAQDIAAHYVTTLATWRANFMHHRAEVRALGFDERFMRMWEYYLALSESGFATGLVQDQQLILEKRRGVA
jgi:cyclopropane-fatty-acyl-phospholipid synthase